MEKELARLKKEIERLKNEMKVITFFQQDTKISRIYSIYPLSPRSQSRISSE